MEAALNGMLNELLPLLQSFCRSEYGIALGGAHAKGVDDAESDLDLYVFAREVLPAAERTRLCEQFSSAIEQVSAWGEDGPLVQGGTDFYYQHKKVEVWFRGLEHINQIIVECQSGQAKREYVAWTVMGFFNYCTLSDLNQMVPVDDPQGILGVWKRQVSVYPPKLKQRILTEHYFSAKFWPENFHYKTAVERCDVLYTSAIVQQVVEHLIQIVFALNEVYFPGEKKLAAALDHLAIKPEGFPQRIQQLVFPAVPAERSVLAAQRLELTRLVAEIEPLFAQMAIDVSLG